MKTSGGIGVTINNFYENSMDDQIKLVRRCEWEEVFLSWYKNEGEDPHWNATAKERGFASWADWRLRGYAKRFKCEKAKWGFYEIQNPSETVLDWYGGPFITWIEKFYEGESTASFSRLVKIPEVVAIHKIQSIKENFPKDTIISALRLKDGRIFVVEGMHRTCALALMAKEGKPLEGKLIFAIGESDLPELFPVGQNTSKN